MRSRNRDCQEDYPNDGPEDYSDYWLEDYLNDGPEDYPNDGPDCVGEATQGEQCNTNPCPDSECNINI